MKRTLFFFALFALSACGKKPVTLSHQDNSPSTPAAIAANPKEVGTDRPALIDVEAPLQVDLDPQALENQRVKEEVLKRIDLMPRLSPESKDKLYVQVERARAMGKVITIPFPSGHATLDDNAIHALGEKLQLEQVRTLIDDPTVVLVVLGFADKNGDPKQNQEISLERANAVLDVLQNKFQLMNVMHSVGMGGSEMFDAHNLDKNRVVELWAVLP